MSGKVLPSRLKRKWKVLASLDGVWLVFMFPIPFLPLFGQPVDPTSIQVLVMTPAIVSVPFTLLAIFMNGGRSNSDKKTTVGGNI